MCSHLSLNQKPQVIAERYRLQSWQKINELLPVYHNNAYNYQVWPVITGIEPDALQLMHWGLIPSWARSNLQADKLKKNTINARIESIFEKPSFEDAARRRHCLIPATGYFEWQDIKGKKYPYFIYLKSGEVFSMAGIWDTWTDHDTGATKDTFSILTTEANPLVAGIHNLKQRMPVILTEETENAWLTGGFDATSIQVFMKPFDAHKMDAYTIGRHITEKNSDTPAVLKPYTYPEFMQTSLF
ncbi:SOS response-associated peptidase [Emticicia sp. TH156]|uniref:SOS response-associated peptidase n=1 Tax=Emticicia sp. TH156 TaxID=2067454 RepID=UPI000CC25338|nr:SOS response-associated peptidase [Emticicia sp. TH156]PLK42581.1 SOS response-associated peptidase [Emticicia sp. TH156]